MTSLDFYFDYLSPYAYFAWFSVQELCKRRGLELRVHPVLFAGLLNHWGQLGPAEIPPKREFTFKDCYRYAALHHLPFAMPKFHPFNPLTALRLSLPEVSGEHQIRVIGALWKAAWEKGGDLASREDIETALREAGLNAETLFTQAASPEAKAALREETERAIARGVFGVPTVIVGDELFWGNDRLHYVELYLDGKDPLDQRLVSDMRLRPRGSDRPGKGPLA